MGTPQHFRQAFSLSLSKPCLSTAFVHFDLFFICTAFSITAKYDLQSQTQLAVGGNIQKAGALFKALILKDSLAVKYIHSSQLVFVLSVRFCYLAQHRTCFSVNSVCPKVKKCLIALNHISVTVRDNIFSLLCLQNCLGQQDCQDS